MSPAERAHRRLLELADSLEPALRRSVLRVMQSLTPGQMADVVRLLERGDVDAVVQLVFSRPEVTEATNKLRAEWTAGVIRLAAKVTADLRQQVALRVLVEPVVSQPIIDAVRRWDDTAFRAIQRDLQDGLRESVAQRLAAGMGPRQVAVALKANMASGLTAYDERIIASFEQALAEGRHSDALRRALRDKRSDRSLLKGKPLTAEQRAKMVAAYRRKLTAFRAETFARTAAIDAANEANYASWMEGVRQGLYVADDVRCYWIVADDERLCPICGQVPKDYEYGVTLGQPFQLIDGRMLLRPTAHARCRCTLWIELLQKGVAPARTPTPLLLTT